MPFRLINTPGGPIAASRKRYFETGSVHWDDLLNMDQLHAYLGKQAERMKDIPAPDRLLAPIGSQEIWARASRISAAALPGWRNRSKLAVVIFTGY